MADASVPIARLWPTTVMTIPIAGNQIQTRDWCNVWSCYGHSLFRLTIHRSIVRWLRARYVNLVKGDARAHSCRTRVIVTTHNTRLYAPRTCGRVCEQTHKNTNNHTSYMYYFEVECNIRPYATLAFANDEAQTNLLWSALHASTTDLVAWPGTIIIICKTWRLSEEVCHVRSLCLAYIIFFLSAPNYHCFY